MRHFRPRHVARDTEADRVLEPSRIASGWTFAQGSARLNPAHTSTLGLESETHGAKRRTTDGDITPVGSVWAKASDQSQIPDAGMATIASIGSRDAKRPTTDAGRLAG